MTTGRKYSPERRHSKLTPGRSLELLRELQGLTQSELGRRTGIAQSAISAFESGAQEMGLKRVKVLAEALGVHPAVIAFPDYEEPARTLRNASSFPSLARTAAPAKRKPKSGTSLSQRPAPARSAAKRSAPKRRRAV